ncbi:metallophosphoesterase [Candidatus Pacearchaeota archaeon]|jgi:DNA polymerase II small subunit|nr:metallophosphoesterase [Candidatus Pacearchaeota archaeon]
MNTSEILRFCLEKGFLLDNEVLGLFNETSDVESVKLIIERIKETTNQRIITKNLFNQNKEKVSQILMTLPKENQQNLEKLKIKLGLSIEISKEVSHQIQEENISGNVKVLSTILNNTKKIEVQDFVKYFRSRISEFKKILLGNASLKNPVSINKLSSTRQNVSIIGIVSDKSVTKNKNLVFEVEDITGKIKILVNQNNKELYEKANEICLDSVLGFNGIGNNEIIFANDIIFPEANLPERKKSPVDESAVFMGDLHLGSKLFLENSFDKFISYLNGKSSNSTEAEKIKYLFIVGDVIAGVGNYPSQERDLLIKDIEEQFIALSEKLKKIRKDINIIISPGNHDGVRLMEPQPLFHERYAWSLYDLKNVILTGNPATVNIGSTKDFSGMDVLTYHGFSYPYYANVIPSLISADSMKSPDKIMTYLLKNRHLAPAHASVQYYPSEEDHLMIKKIPDIFVSGHTHKSAVSYYSNTLLISSSSWEGKTAYEEKLGAEPDFCKIPMFNLKTRAIKILDFEEKEDD